MTLKIFTPSKVLKEISVKKIIGEDTNGSFCLLPRHIDCVRILVPGLLMYVSDGPDKYVGIDEGVLVKCKDEVRISVKNAVYGIELGKIKEKLDTDLKKIDENEKKVRSILMEIEVDFIKKYVETTKT
jgi:F-type H+-transporting ATPase subunit epsilon